MIITVTATHRTDDFAVLERLASIDPDALVLKLREVHGVLGAVVVSTCNRFEMYLDVEQHGALEAALAVVGVPFAGAVLVRDEAAEHLFSVASGLDSVVVGEGEIAGQVRRAHRSAQELGATTSALERLFQRAHETQREVKRRANVGDANRSVIRLALDLASAQLPSWADARVLLVGTGNYAGTAVRALRDRGVTSIDVWSPSGRERAFAQRHGTGRVTSETLAAAAPGADVIVTCSAGEGYAIGPELVHAGQVVIDMGLPRNVDPAVGALPDVRLLDLETVRLHAPVQHLVTAADARRVVRAAAAEFALAGDAQRLAPAVTALRRHVNEALEAELERVRGRGSEEQQRAAEAALRHFAGVILHTPSVRARELAASGRHDDYLVGLDALFGLEA